MNWRILVATVLLVAGGTIELLAVVGLCVMRDLYDRMHFVGLIGYGALLIAVAIVRESFSLIGDKALLVGVVLVLTGPVLVQTTMRSMLIREHGDWRAARAGGKGPVTMLQVAALAAVAVGGGAVVSPDPLRQVIVLGIFGLALTMLFFVFQDPDVALSEIVVSTVGLPVMVLLALRKVKEHERQREEQDRGAGPPGALPVRGRAAGCGGARDRVHGPARLRRVPRRVRTRDRRYWRHPAPWHRPDHALNFDVRAFDTLGEEFILFASVLGIVLILR